MYDRFLRGRHIASVIYEHFRATSAKKAVQGLSDLFNIRLQNDNDKDFDVRWDQALLSTSETPTEIVLKGLYKSEFQCTVQLQTVLAVRGVVLTIRPISSADEIVVVRVGFHADVDMAETSGNVVGFFLTQLT